MIKRCISGFLLAGLLAACSSREASAPALPSGTPGETVIRTGVLTYAAGDVTVQENGSWGAIDTGDSVAEDAVVRTGKRSACDIQFEQFGIVHLSENTTLALKTVGIGTRRRAVDVELVVGSVTAKISKLAGADRFQVKTDTVICGVRGTRFVVTRTDATATRVAVAEGTVALIPPSYDPQNWESLAVSSAAGAQAEAAEAQILTRSPAVGAGWEAVVTKASMQQPSAAVAQIQAALAAALSAPTPERSDAVSEALDAYHQSFSEPAPQRASPESQKTLEETAGLKILETLPPKKADPRPESPPAPFQDTALGKPRAVSPSAGQTIDIVKTSSLAFTWKPVAGATRYEARLYRVTGTSRTLVKSWNTTASSVLLKNFDGLQAGSFAWEVDAIRDGDLAATSTGPATVFQIVQGSALPGPALDLSGDPLSTTNGGQP